MYDIYMIHMYTHIYVLGILKGEKSKDTTINKNLRNLKVIKWINIENWSHTKINFKNASLDIQTKRANGL